ncbi:MAG: DUF6132 family protein [Ignavibacteria bacterium]|nr:DUF6132 family protein [Ignavibacteria bacterium]
MKQLIRILLGVILGGGVGFAYYYFWGCNSEGCLLSSNPIVSILWGSIIGAIIFFPTKNGKPNNQSNNN